MSRTMIEKLGFPVELTAKKTSELTWADRVDDEGPCKAQRDADYDTY